MCNSITKLNESLIKENKANKLKLNKKSFDLENFNSDSKDNKEDKEKFKFIEKKDFRKYSPIRLQPIDLKKIRIDKELQIKSTFNKINKKIYQIYNIL